MSLAITVTLLSIPFLLLIGSPAFARKRAPAFARVRR